jgi:hypothetical protein
MNARSGLVASIAGASLFLGITEACASPSTVYMEGTTALYSDYFTGTGVPGYAGQPFSVKVSLNIANGTLNASSLPDNSYSNSYSVRGCLRIVNGTCTVDFGAQLPVVTDYSINVSFAPAGGFRPIPASTYYWDLTSRVNQSLAGINPPMDIYAIERSQEQCTFIAGDPEAYEESCIGTFFYVYLSTNVNTMFGSLANLMDLNTTPNLADVPPGYLGFTYMSFERIDACAKEVDQEPVCEVLAYLPGSFLWSGTLTSVVAVGEGPTTKEACKKNAWKAFGFKNQGQCVSYVNHLP